jgi:uncharacterized protein with PIN domain
MPSPKKFLVDINLGRLAKWLRFLGYDTLYYQKVSLYALSRIANSEKRVFLTRSEKNSRLKIFNDSILIKSSNFLEQLSELKSLITLDQELLFSRCSLCNKPLFSVEKEKLAHLIPEYIFQSQQDFKICRACGKIYWNGTHQHKISNELEKLYPSPL